MSWILIQFLLCDLQSVSSPEFLWPLLWIILSDIRYPARLPGSRNHKHNICSQYFETVTCVTYILESCKKGTDKCDKNICDSAWQNINCPQLCVPVSRCLYWVAMLCWPWGQVAVTMRSWWTWHNVTLSGRVNISLSKISKQFTKPTAFTQPQEVTFEAPSQKMPRLDRATRACRGNLSIFRVLSISALRRWRSHLHLVTFNDSPEFRLMLRRLALLVPN